MAFQLPRNPEAFSRQPTGKISKRIEDKNYLDFVRSLPCIITGVYGVEAAHISLPSPQYGKLGRGLGRKESDRWTLPLSQESHRRQHEIGEEKFWDEVGINPFVVALSLYGVYPNEELALLVIRNIERRRV